MSLMNTLTELLDKSPFQSFKIFTSSGDKYLIKNPHLVAVGRDVVFIFTADGHFAFVRNNQITAVQSSRNRRLKRAG